MGIEMQNEQAKGADLKSAATESGAEADVRTPEPSLQRLTERQLLEREAATTRALQREVDLMIQQAQRRDGWTMSVC